MPPTAVIEVEAYTRLAGVYDEIVVDPCYPLWARFLDRLWRSDTSGVRDVLDVCCGTGLMAAELIALGYRVVGTDAAPSMLQRARHLLGPDAKLIEARLPTIGTTETFDAAISTFDGLNYLTPQDFRLSLATIADRLRPGGWFVFDLHTDAMMAFTAANPVVEGSSGGNQFVITSEVSSDARQCATTIEMKSVEGGAPFTERHVQYFHDADQVQADLTAAGFDSVARYDEYTDAQADEETLRATCVARLPVP